MKDYAFIIALVLAIIVFLIFNLSRDKRPRIRFMGNRSWHKQANFMFSDGVVLILALIILYILMRIIRWSWIAYVA